MSDVEKGGVRPGTRVLIRGTVVVPMVLLLGREEVVDDQAGAVGASGAPDAV
jgi:hypothetical protein